MIGIGGSSMSGLAEILISMGYRVSGSDLNSTAVTKNLEKIGVDIYYNHFPDNIKNPDLVVYTVAVKMDNPELARAVSLCIPVIDRATLLGEIMSLYSNTVSVSGTHGKTTTTSMISTILTEMGKDPTVHLGGTIKKQDNNVRIGKSDYFITEACEYYNSFHKLKANIGIILNIEPDHLDFFGTAENVYKSFETFANLIPKDGYLIIWEDDKTSKDIAKKVNCNVVTFGFDKDKANFAAENISYSKEGYGQYSLYVNKKYAADIFLSVPGRHNIANSLAAIASCYYLGCGISDIAKSIKSFTGSARRFEIKGTYDGITVVDDYAHHPTEIRATLASCANGQYKNVWCIFQPHTYSRTKALFDDFAKSFSQCHKVIIADIYSASREKDPGDINSSMLVDAVNKYSGNALYLGSIENIADYIRENAKSGDIVISTGAGNINIICDMLLGKN